MQTPASPSRAWRPQLLALALLALIGTLPFWLSDLDLRVAALFYHPAAADPWWESSRDLWAFLYQASPLLGGLILIGSLLSIAATRIWRSQRRRRRYAIFVLAVTLLGPGLIINGVIKDYWGRPRPHQTVALGGTQPYVPPLKRTPGGLGKSFPSGHSAIGFALGVFYFIWARRRPRLALAAALASVALGTLLGIGRMTAGDHFLSDLIWSAVLTYGVAFVLYWLVLRIPQWEDATAVRPPPAPRPLRHPRLTLGAYLLTAAALLFAVLLATPVQETSNLAIARLPAASGPRTLRLAADAATLTLFQLGTPAVAAGEAASIRLKGRGCGLPASRVQGRLERADDTLTYTLTYTVTHTGVFTERDSTVTVGIDPTAWERIEMVTGSGDIRIYPLGNRRPQLALTADRGLVLDDNRVPAGTPTGPAGASR